MVFIPLPTVKHCGKIETQKFRVVHLNFGHV